MHNHRPFPDNIKTHHQQRSGPMVEMTTRSEIGSGKHLSETDEELQCAPTVGSFSEDVSSEDLSDEEILNDSFSPKNQDSDSRQLKERRHNQKIRKSLMKVFSSPHKKFSIKCNETNSDENQTDQRRRHGHKSGICSFPSQKNTGYSMSSKIREIKKTFSPSTIESGQVKSDNVHSNIGLLLALPDKVHIMRGLEAPNTCKDRYNTLPVEKKLLILPKRANGLKANLGMSIKSPFKSIPRSPHRHVEIETHNDILPNSTSASTEIDILRTGEIDPSAHQVIIPEISELLVHGRVCMVMEGYDNLMQAQARAGKMWFDFANFVGLSRRELESMFLSTMDKESLDNTFYSGEKEELPPPLLTTQRSPFKELLRKRSNESLDSGSLHAEASKLGQKLVRLKQMISTPHRSTLRNLLTCSDDLVVEAFFTETISQGSASTSSKVEITTDVVQVAIFSSQRLRQFIVCYRSSSAQHAKPVAKSVKVRNENTKGAYISPY